MLHPFHLLAPLLLATVLATSALSKFRSPGSARQAFRSLRLPEWLLKVGAADALPWGELVLAVGLMVLPGGVGVVASVAALLLMVVYLVIIVRALGFDEAVTCGCFGELGLGDVTWRTAVRNVLLVGFGLFAVLASIRDDQSPVERWMRAPSEDWGWLSLIVVVLALGWLITAGSRKVERAEPSVSDAGAPELEYLRVPTPYATVARSDGTKVTLRELSGSQAQLLIFVSSTCGSCVEVLQSIPAWTDQLAPAVAVRAVFAASGPDGLGSRDESLIKILPEALFDVDHSASQVLNIEGTPSAVLLGTDLLLAGGPVAGQSDVRQLVADVSVELEAAYAI